MKLKECIHIYKYHKISTDYLRSDRTIYMVLFISWHPCFLSVILLARNKPHNKPKTTFSVRCSHAL